MPWNTAGNIKGPKGDKGDPGNAADIAALIHAATAKIPADADELPILDSGASWALRKFTWASLKTALQDVFFYRGNIVGTVSQSGGVPTGAIIQSGSNANGEWVRFADGTQVCTASISVGVVSTAHGSIFRSAPASWTFPNLFIARPKISGIVGSGVSYGFVGNGFNAGSASSYEVSVQSAVATSLSVVADVVALGRWF